MLGVVAGLVLATLILAVSVWRKSAAVKTELTTQSAQESRRDSTRPVSTSASKPARSSENRIVLPAQQRISLFREKGESARDGDVALEDGTPIRLRFRQSISSADAEVGDRVEFEVLDEVRSGNLVLVCKGASAFGTVKEATPKRWPGRGGRIGISMDFVQLANGGRAPLRTSRQSTGSDSEREMAGTVETKVVPWPVAPVLLFTDGQEATLRKGQELKAYIDGPVHLAPRADN